MENSNTSKKNRRWVIIVGGNQFGTDNPNKRLTKRKEHATRFTKYHEALWRAECIMYENPNKDVRVMPWKDKKKKALQSSSSV